MTRQRAGEEREEVVMLQIKTSTWVPGLMKLLTRNAICLRLLSPPPQIARPSPPPLLSGLYHGGLAFGENGVVGGRWRRRRVSEDDEFLIFLTFTCPIRD